MKLSAEKPVVKIAQLVQCIALSAAAPTFGGVGIDQDTGEPRSMALFFTFTFVT